MKTVLLHKNGMIAVLGIRELVTGQAVLVRIDPRDGEVSKSLQDSPDVAEKNLQGSIRKSVRRGWRLIHFGEPNQG